MYVPYILYICMHAWNFATNYSWVQGQLLSLVWERSLRYVCLFAWLLFVLSVCKWRRCVCVRVPVFANASFGVAWHFRNTAGHFGWFSFHCSLVPAMWRRVQSLFHLWLWWQLLLVLLLLLLYGMVVLCMHRICNSGVLLLHAAVCLLLKCHQ